MHGDASHLPASDLEGTENKRSAKANQTDASRIGVDAGITPLELAHLAAALASAKMIPAPESEDDSAGFEPNDYPRHLIAAAADFFELCKEVIEVRRMADGMSQQEAAFNEKSNEWLKIYKRESDSDKFSEIRIPVEEVLKLAGADRSKLGDEELRAVGEKKHWERLSISEQKQNMYLFLTHPQRQFAAPKFHAKSGSRTTVHSPYAHVKLPLKTRKEEAANGIPLSKITFNAICALRENLWYLNRTKKISAGKSHQKKMRSEAGRFAKQSRSGSGQFEKKV